MNNVTLTLDDAGLGSLPDSGQIVTGIYKPTNVGAGDTFAAPAPTGPYNALLSAFNGTGPNGPWALYVVDDEPGDHGAVAGGWSLAINTAAPNAPPSISAVADQTTPANTPTPPIAFTVGDAETAAVSLTLGATSSNRALVPDAAIVFGGTGASRTVTVSQATPTVVVLPEELDPAVESSEKGVLLIEDDARHLIRVLTQFWKRTSHQLHNRRHQFVQQL